MRRIIRFFQTSIYKNPASSVPVISVCALVAFSLGVSLFFCTGVRDKPDRSAKIHSHVNAAPVTHLTQPQFEDAVLRRLCEEDERHLSEISFDEVDLERKEAGALRQVNQGISNSARLLSLAKELTLAVLRENAARFDTDASELDRAAEQINAVSSVVLDESLGNSAEVDDEQATKIRIGPKYALYLTQDEEAVFLLGHELMHVAAMNDNLRNLITATAGKAKTMADVYPTPEQEEDLTCDFVGEQVLKRFVLDHPSKESVAGRFSRALDYDCDTADGGDEQDEEHLGQGATIRALLALDPELGRLIMDN